ncbi:MAG: hypothetical protein QMD04_06650 [Anaerolineales bacterium]|nr:hypothetical protein [Anaerolineales bacterium]
MNKISSWMRVIAISLVLTMIALLFPSYSARADIAPPEQPPGANIRPYGEVTQVRMVRETVLVSVLKSHPASSQGQAVVIATFVMRNLSSMEEYLDVRFPLSMRNWLGEVLEIKDFRAKVDNVSVGTRRLWMPDCTSGYCWWAVFPVTFPPGQDVLIEATYTAEGTAWDYNPAIEFGYIMATGAGWNGTIGSADIIVRLPYEASRMNVEFGWNGLLSGFANVEAEPVFTGQEVRWHLEDFEPDGNYNFRVYVTRPSTWLRVLNERENVNKNPNDGEAWGRLGKAYKDVIDWGKYYRQDPAGWELFELSIEAYDKAVTLLPDDALWHFGFAELLEMGYSSYNHMGYGSYSYEALLLRAMQELSISLRLDPTNQRAIDMADWMSDWLPTWVQKTGSDYIFLALTATPTPEPSQMPTSIYCEDHDSPGCVNKPTRTPTITPTRTTTITPTLTTASLAQSPTPAVPSGAPLCGAALILPAVAAVLRLKLHRQA